MALYIFGTVDGDTICVVFGNNIAYYAKNVQETISTSSKNMVV